MSLIGKPGELGTIVVSLHLMGLCASGEPIVGLVPEGGAVVGTKLLIQEDITQGIDLDLACGWVPS